jgi:hypothetical protein
MSRVVPALLRTARMANASSSGGLTMGTSPGLIRTTSDNQLGNQIIPSPLANQRRRARTACGHVCPLTRAHARSEVATVTTRDIRRWAIAGLGSCGSAKTVRRFPAGPSCRKTPRTPPSRSTTRKDPEKMQWVAPSERDTDNETLERPAVACRRPAPRQFGADVGAVFAAGSRPDFSAVRRSSIPGAARRAGKAVCRLTPRIPHR